MKTVLVAPDSFKGSLSAVDFCRIVERAGQGVADGLNFISRPMSDGGEGFVESITYAGLAESHEVIVQDPLGRPVAAKFGWQPESRTAIVEMAQASGLPRLAKHELNPMAASTYGTGQVLAAAIRLGAEKIILGLGGSATNDGGAGALQALGFDFRNAQGDSLAFGGGALVELDHIARNAPGLVKSDLNQIEWVIACDVSNPLLGEQGATAVFGPQKGVDETSAPILEAGLKQLAKVIEADWGKRIEHLPGAGAAGGMAGTFVGLLDARLTSGFDLLAELLSLNEVLRDGDVHLVITGEGKMDEQTRFGKLPNRIAELAGDYDIPTVGLCGKLEATTQDLPAFFELRSIHEQVPEDAGLASLLQQSEQNLEKTIQSHLKNWL